MSWINDRENRWYFGFAVAFCLLLMIFCLWSGWMQGVRVRDSLFQWERAAASSLLEQGIGRGTIAQAFSSETVTEEGESLLRVIGHTEENVPILFLCPMRRYGRPFRYFWRREQPFLCFFCPAQFFI